MFGVGYSHGSYFGFFASNEQILILRCKNSLYCLAFEYNSYCLMELQAVNCMLTRLRLRAVLRKLGPGRNGDILLLEIDDSRLFGEPSVMYCTESNA